MDSRCRLERLVAPNDENRLLAMTGSAPAALAMPPVRPVMIQVEWTIRWLSTGVERSGVMSEE